MALMFDKQLLLIDTSEHKKLQAFKLNQSQAYLQLTPTFDLTNMPVAIVHSNKSILEAYDVQGSGYKGKIDLLGIGLE